MGREGKDNTSVPVIGVQRRALSSVVGAIISCTCSCSPGKWSPISHTPGPGPALAKANADGYR